MAEKPLRVRLSASKECFLDSGWSEEDEGGEWCCECDDEDEPLTMFVFVVCERLESFASIWI